MAPTISEAGRRKGRLRRGVPVAAGTLLLLLAGPVHAQHDLRGTIVGPEVEPVAGALVRLLEAGADEPRASALTDTAGHFVFRGLPAGEYRLLIERLGYATWTSEPTVVPAAGALRLVLPTAPVELDGVGVEASKRCTVPPDEAARAMALLPIVRAALAKVHAGDVEAGYGFVARILQERYDTHRFDDRPRYKGVGHWTDTTMVRVPRPLASRTPEELARAGFARGSSAEDSFPRYYAPDPEALMSDAFALTHCFGYAEHDTEPWVGLTFAPTPGRDVPDVEGVVWIDLATGDPRRVEFRYVGLESFIRHEDAARLSAFKTAQHGIPIRVGSITFPEEPGGEIEFAELPTGDWFTRRWVLRAAHIPRHSATGQIPRQGGFLTLHVRTIATELEVVAVLPPNR